MFDAVETQKKCSVDSSHPGMKSEALARIVRPRQRFGYDLIVYVGLARYLRRKQREEICEELLHKRAIKLSPGSVSNLCDRFLLYLEALHLVRSFHLKLAMQKHGYPLHIDATSEHGKGGLFVCMDGFRDWVLYAGKIESESEEHLKPFVERTIELFGDPIAIVRDLGPPGKNAVAFLAQRGIPDFVCHYHFLGVIGEKIFDSPYALLRKLLSQSHVRSDSRQLLKEMKRYRGKVFKKGCFGPGRIREDLLALVHWVIEGEGKKDAVYPFSLPHLKFFQRCRAAMQRADIWVPAPRSQPERRALRHLEGLIRRLEKDKRFQTAVGRLEKGWYAFTQARNTLRLTDAALSFSKPKRSLHSLGLALAACVLLVLSFLVGANFYPEGEPVDQSISLVPATVQHRFVIFQQGSAQVEITGSFTEWRKVALKQTSSEGYWEITLNVPSGEHRYSFIIDGNKLLPDPTVATKEPDDFGTINSILYVES